MEDKKDLWSGKRLESWYDRPLETMPSDEIETKWGKAEIKVLGDYTIEVNVIEPINLYRVLYNGRFYFKVNLSSETYHLENNCYRITEIKPNGERVLMRGYQYEQLTNAARKAMDEELTPPLTKWVENNGHLLLKGYTLKQRNQIQQARYKLDEIEFRISERRKYLSLLEEELRANGGLSQEEQNRLNNLWDSSWRFS